MCDLSNVKESHNGDESEKLMGNSLKTQRD